MIDRTKLAAALLVVGAVLLIAPAMVPVQSVLYHEIQGAVPAEEDDLQQRGVEVIAYENLSERGKELYERTLRNDGSYIVAAGSGASDFEYRADPATEGERDVRQRFGPRTVAIERPDDPDFPTVDSRPVQERRPPGNDDTAANGTTEERQDPERYDILQTRLGQPPLTDGGNLLRFLSVLIGVVTVGSGGYLRSRP